MQTGASYSMIRFVGMQNTYVQGLIRKGLISFTTVAVLTSAVPAFAQTVNASSSTTTSATTTVTSITGSIQDQIAALLAEITTLKAQIAMLVSNNASLQGAVNQIQTSLKLTSTLQPGMSGDGVKTLQTVLATDPTLFPADSVTGFFGPLTEEAVKNFQKHFGIDAVGVVGPHTMEKINELLKEHDVTSANDLNENELGDLGDSNENATSSASHDGEHGDGNATSSASREGEHGDGNGGNSGRGDN